MDTYLTMVTCCRCWRRITGCTTQPRWSQF